MIPPHFYYQLVVLGLLWLCVMLHLAWSSPGTTPQTKPAMTEAAGYRAARNWQLRGTLQDRVELAGQAYVRLQRPREPLTLVPWQAQMAPYLGHEVTLTLTQRVPGRWEVTDITRVLGLVRSLEPTRTRQRGWHPDLDTEEREHDQGRERWR